jgi:hypothetical protein
MEAVSSSETLVADTNLHDAISQNMEIFFAIFVVVLVVDDNDDDDDEDDADDDDDDDDDDNDDDDDDDVKLHFFLQDLSAYFLSTLVTDILLHYVKVSNALTNIRASPFTTSVPICQTTRYISFKVFVYSLFFLWETKNINEYTVWGLLVIE